MYLIIGLIRSSVLYAFVLSLFHGAFFPEFAVVYGAFVVGNFLASKFSKEGMAFTELLLEMIQHDLLVPILGIRSLVLILLGKYLDSPSEDHASLFMAQGIIEGIWGTLIAICIMVTILQLI